jgi:hypothetical protein
MALLFEHNINALASRDPGLTGRMTTLKPDRTIRTIEAASGPLTAFQSTPDGRTLFFHSRIDPLEEGAAWAEVTAPRGCDVFILGMGLGYHVRSLADSRTGIKSIHVIEASDQLFHAALRTADLSTLLSHSGIDFWIGNRLEDLTAMISSLSSPLSYHLYLPVLSLDPEYYDAIMRQLERKLYQIRLAGVCAAEGKNSHFFGKGIERLMDEIVA